MLVLWGRVTLAPADCSSMATQDSTVGLTDFLARRWTFEKKEPRKKKTARQLRVCGSIPPDASGANEQRASDELRASPSSDG